MGTSGCSRLDNYLNNHLLPMCWKSGEGFYKRFFFPGSTGIIWKFLDQGSDLHLGIDPSHCRDNAGSLTPLGQSGNTHKQSFQVSGPTDVQSRAI